MSLVCIVLSIDTIVAVMSFGSAFWYLALLLVMSALIRFFFISPIARFLQNYPNINVIILTFLIIIGVSLVLEGFGLQLPEVLINLILALVVLIVIFIEKQRTRYYHSKRLASWENALNSNPKEERHD
jgi:predicted tellurium resistance membrane protein TerC